MSIADIDHRRGAMSEFVDSVTWSEAGPGSYECRAYVLREQDGFSAYVADLPGVASQGETAASALDNLKEAFRGALAVYQSESGQIPWLPRPEEKPPEALERWILVDV